MKLFKKPFRRFGDVAETAIGTAEDVVIRAGEKVGRIPERVRNLPTTARETYRDMRDEDKPRKIFGNSVKIAIFTPAPPPVGTLAGIVYGLRQFYIKYFNRKSNYTRRFGIDEVAPDWIEELLVNEESERAYQEYLYS
jgi:hypothetical protein